MKLYDCERNRWIMPIDDAKAPPGARPISAAEPVYFHHVDGMYSFCKDVHGNVVHLPAWQEVSYTEPL